MSFGFKPRSLRDIRAMWKQYYQEIVKNKLKLGNVEEVDFTPEYRFNQRTVACVTKFFNEQTKIVQDPGLKVYQLPTEPDGNQLVLWHMCNSFGSIGNVVVDDSGFRHNAVVIGNPSKAAGPVNGLSTINYNGSTDFARIDNTGLINTAGGAVAATESSNAFTASAMTSMSVEFWIKPRALSLTTGNRPRILLFKSDQRSGTSVTRGWICWVEPDGTIWVSYRHNNSTVYSCNFAKALKTLIDFYFVVFTISNIGGAVTIKIYVNSVESGSATITNKTPVFPSTESTGLSMYIGGTDEGPNIAKIEGSIGDVRLWRNKALTQTEVNNQWGNKYTIANITNVARINAFYLPVEATPGGSNPGDPPGPAPDITTQYGFSALGFQSEDFTIDLENAAAPGGMGISGGTTGSGVDPLIPPQLMDTFNPTISYTLTSLNQLSTNSKWKLSALPGTGGFVRTELYQHPGEQAPTNILRMKHGTAAPLVTTNNIKFDEFYARIVLRTISQNSVNDYNTAHIMLKYVDASNYAYLVLRPSNIEIRKVLAGVETVVGTGPTRSNIFQVGSIHVVEIWYYDDGQFIEVVADTDAAASKLTIGSHSPGAVSVDTVLGSVSAMGIRANNSEIEIDSFLVRPLLSDGFENGSPWNSLNSANAISPNGKWKTLTASGTGGNIRTLTTGGGTFNNILDIKRGTADPILLSQTTFTNLQMEWAGITDSQLVVSQNNRLQIIFKWVDANNFYYFVAHPSGWQVRRVLSGTDTLRVSSTANGVADAAAFTASQWKILVTNSGADFEVWKGTSLLYKEEFGIIKQAATGGSNIDTVSDDDGGLLAGPGKVGFRATQSDCAVAWVSVFPS